MALNKAPDWTLSVSELNEYVRKALASDPVLRYIKLRAELSGVKYHASVHIYFTLKDKDARIQAVMFRTQARELAFELRDGLKVVAEGSVSLYAAAGAYQFYADAIKPDGQGSLFEQFLKLKAKLMSEGIFDEALKKPLPMCAQRVGIITSPTGAVVHDIQTVAARRNPAVQLELCPVNVQGAAAAGEIARAIALMDRRGYDALIVGRGGGSLEDLWAFNEEKVARAIFKCRTPVVSAVGHEIDFTIADFAADVRAATPSVAAEMVIADRAAMQRLLADMGRRLARTLAAETAAFDARLSRLCTRLEALNPARRVGMMEMRLAARRQELLRAGQSYMTAKAARLEQNLAALKGVKPASRLDAADERLKQLATRLTQSLAAIIYARVTAVKSLSARLRALSPARALNRGYAIIKAGGAAVSSAQAIQPGDMLDIVLGDGRISALTIALEDGHTEEFDG